MRDDFRSSLLFFRANKGAVILLIATLSLIFFACLVLHSLSRIGFLEAEKYAWEYSRVYAIEYQPANQEMTDVLVDSLRQLELPIVDFSIHGEAELITTPGVNIIIEENGYSGSMSRATNNSEGSIIHVPLIGFVSRPSMPIELLRGTDKIGESDVLLDCSTYDMLFFRFYQYTDSPDYDTFLTLGNGEIRKIAGVVQIPSFLSYEGVLVDQNHFFTIADYSTSLQVSFSSPLTEEEEQTWISEAKRHVSISDVVYPLNDIEASIQNESIILTLLSRILILVCLLCSMRLMTYLFLLRKQEFSVIRLLGASYAHIETQIVVMILEVASVSVGIGTTVYLLLVVSRVAEVFLPKLPLDLIVSDILFFLISSLIIGFAMFILNHKIDITHANEEV